MKRGGETIVQWSAQSRDNIGTDKVLGDTLWDTREQALDYAKQEYQRAIIAQQRLAEAEAEEASAQAALEARKADKVNGFIADDAPANKAELLRKNLDKQIRIDGKAATLREHIEAWSANDALDLSTYEEWKIKPMSRTAFNRASNQEQRAHEDKQKAAGKKTVHLVNQYDLGKTAYDYAQHLVSLKAGDSLEQVEPEVQEPEAAQAATSIQGVPVSDAEPPVSDDPTVTGEPAPERLPAWELPRATWVDEEIRSGKYADEYLADARAYALRAGQLNARWVEQLMLRSRLGRVSDTSLDDLVARDGLDALRMFRGVYEPGIEGYLSPELRGDESTGVPAEAPAEAEAEPEVASEQPVEFDQQLGADSTDITGEQEQPFEVMASVVRVTPTGQVPEDGMLGYVGAIEGAGTRGWRVQVIDVDDTDHHSYFYTADNGFEVVGSRDNQGNVVWAEGYNPAELEKDSLRERMQRWLAVATDSIEQLRSPDVYRVLQDRQNPESLAFLAQYIIDQRPELEQEVLSSVTDISAESGWENPFASNLDESPAGKGGIEDDPQRVTVGRDPVLPDEARSAPVDLDASDGAYAIDRDWQGFVAEDLLLAESDTGYFSPAQPFSALKKGETEGIGALESQQRRAILRFMGWGGIHQEVRANNARASQNHMGNIIAGYLGMDSGRYSEVMLENRLESYYTPGSVITAMWGMLERAGLPADARVLDAGCGSGRFFIGAPEQLQRHGTFVGVERDPIAVRLARFGVPDAVIIESPYEQAVLDRRFDAVVGNVPFGETKIFDNRYPEAQHIHDYFIVRSLDHLKPGAIMAVMTSSGTMDKRDTKVRQQMMDRADLVAGFRLPASVFADQGAQVTTDILLLQKRPPGTKPSFDYTGTDRVSVAYDDEAVEFEINNYFTDHPEQVLGEVSAVSGAFGPRMSVVSEADVASRLHEAIAVIPEGIMQRSEWEPIEVSPGSAAPAPMSFEFEDTGSSIDEYDGYVGDMFVQGDDIYEVIDLVPTFDDAGVQNGSRFLTLKLELSREQSATVKAYIPLRDATRQLMAAQLQGNDDELAEAQQRAQKAYDDFVEGFGPVNGKARKHFGDDPGAAEVCALELWDDDEEDVTSLADTLTKRVIGAESELSIADAADAYYASFDRFGGVNLEYMESVSGIAQDKLIEELNGTHIFRDHHTDKWVTGEEYLTGNVVKRLAEVEQAMLVDMSFKTNFDALMRVQPTRIPFPDIQISIGCNWMPAHEVRDFVSSLVGTKLGEDKLTVRYSPDTAQWTVDASNSFKREYETHRSTLYGTPRASFEVLLEKLMNSQRPSHYDDVDGKKVLNVEATNASRQKQEDIDQQFKVWLASDPERAERFEEYYNSTVNVMRVGKADGSRITFPGLAPTWKPRPHQKDAVAKGMLGYNMFADHPVGAGKTFEMIAMAMKLKQVGHHNKPAIAVPNHMLGQIAREAKQMYPAARILMVQSEDLRGANRRRFLAISRNNDWDFIVCTHSLLNQIQAPLEVQLKKLDDRIARAASASAAAENKRQKRTLDARRKSLESQRGALMKNWEALEASDKVITLDQLGIDALFVDEAHLYKNLELNSSMNVLGVTTGGSKRAANLEDLIEYLREHHGKSAGAHFFSGTSISNSMCELYVHNRLLRPEILQDIGIHNFDEWAKRFGEVVTNLEALPEGGGFRVNERFAKFVNLPEMLRLFHTFADVRTHAQLNLPKPKVHTEIVVSDQSEWQRAFMEHLTRRAQAVRNKSVRPDEDNILSISTAGRKASLDMRLVDEVIPDEGSLKLEAVAQNMVNEWERTENVRGTQLGFLDLGTPGKNKTYSSYERLKAILIEKGIPEKEIAFMQDYKAADKKEGLYAAVRSGSVRILLGSTETMGVGTNVQERLCALHNIDCPWRPSDIEQRIGRIARQGNLFFKDVSEYRYTTKDSFDLFLWQGNQRKATFIEQAKADPELAEREVSEEVDMGYAAVMAVTTGEPRIKEKVEVDDAVSKLERRHRNWMNDRAQRASASRRLDQELASLTRLIDQADQVIEALPKSTLKCVTVSGTITDMQDGPTTWLYATEVGEAVQSRLPFLEAKMQRMGGTDNWESLGISVGDIELGVTLSRVEKLTRIQGRLHGEPLPLNVVRYSKSAQALGRGIRAWFDVEHETKHELLKEKASAEKNKVALGAIDFDAPWPQESELQELKARKAELDDWFSKQDFNKASVGPDPFLQMLEERKSELATLSVMVEDELETLSRGKDDGEENSVADPGGVNDLLSDDLFDDLSYDDTEQVNKASSSPRQAMG